MTFRHSNIGLEPESQAFVFIDDDQVSDGYKLQNQKVKEYENVVPAFLICFSYPHLVLVV